MIMRNMLVYLFCILLGITVSSCSKEKSSISGGAASVSQCDNQRGCAKAANDIAKLRDSARAINVQDFAASRNAISDSFILTGKIVSTLSEKLQATSKVDVSNERNVIDEAIASIKNAKNNEDVVNSTKQGLMSASSALRVIATDVKTGTCGLTQDLQDIETRIRAINVLSYKQDTSYAFQRLANVMSTMDNSTTPNVPAVKSNR